MKEELERYFAARLEGVQEAYGETTCRVKARELLGVAQALRDEEVFGFTFLADLTGIDCGGGEFEVVYHLLSISHKSRVRLKVRLAPGQEISSVVGIWPTANFHERECYDLLGIVFQGHPDLSRILLPEGFLGHPLRKDYPLRGED